MSMIKKAEVFKDQNFEVGAGLIKTSVVIDLTQLAEDYVFSLFAKHGGTGTVKLECFVSDRRDGDWIEACADIVASQATGTASMYAIAPTVAAPFMKFVATASAETVTGLNATLFIR